MMRFEENLERLGLEAELVSIAGNYKVSEDMRDHLWKQSVKIFMKECFRI